MTGFCSRWSRTRWFLLILFVLLLAFCMFPGKREQRPAEGYVGNVYLSFPSDQYTLVTSIKNEGGRKVIQDNLWGFTYPEMQPFRNEHATDVLMLRAPWVRVSVHKRNGMGCFKNLIERYLAPGSLEISWYDLKTPLSAERMTMRKLAGRHLNLNKMQVPEGEDNLYESALIGQDHFRFKKQKYYGPYEIYWSDDFCTTIVCDRFSDGTSRCAQEHAIARDDIYLRMSYDGSLLTGWREIQNEARRTLDSFRGKQ